MPPPPPPQSLKKKLYDPASDKLVEVDPGANKAKGRKGKGGKHAPAKLLQAASDDVVLHEPRDEADEPFAAYDGTTGGAVLDPSPAAAAQRRARRAAARRRRGPRTRGVLYERLDNGEIVVVDSPHMSPEAVAEARRAALARGGGSQRGSAAQSTAAGGSASTEAVPVDGAAGPARRSGPVSVSLATFNYTNGAGFNDGDGGDDDDDDDDYGNFFMGDMEIPIDTDDTPGAAPAAAPAPAPSRSAWGEPDGGAADAASAAATAARQEGNHTASPPSARGGATVTAVSAAKAAPATPTSQTKPAPGQAGQAQASQAQSQPQQAPAASVGLTSAAATSQAFVPMSQRGVLATPPQVHGGMSLPTTSLADMTLGWQPSLGGLPTNPPHVSVDLGAGVSGGTSVATAGATQTWQAARGAHATWTPPQATGSRAAGGVPAYTKAQGFMAFPSATKTWSAGGMCVGCVCVCVCVCVCACVCVRVYVCVVAAGAAGCASLTFPFIVLVQRVQIRRAFGLGHACHHCGGCRCTCRGAHHRGGWAQLPQAGGRRGCCVVAVHSRRHHALHKRHEPSRACVRAAALSCRGRVCCGFCCVCCSCCVHGRLCAGRIAWRGGDAHHASTRSCHRNGVCRWQQLAGHTGGHRTWQRRQRGPWWRVQARRRWWW